MFTTSLVSSVCICLQARTHTATPTSGVRAHLTQTSVHARSRVCRLFWASHVITMPRCRRHLYNKGMCAYAHIECVLTFATTVSVPVPVCDQRACVGVCCMGICCVPPHVSSKAYT